MSNLPKVSVCVTCYQQAELVDQCLESLLTQTTTFPFEVIVSDDASSDHTPSVLARWASAFPDRLRVNINKPNLGAVRNYLLTHSLARGEYVAHMDGDDLALPGKLQIQADVLDRHSDVAISAHATRIIDHDTMTGDERAYPELADMSDLIRLGTYFVHSSVMYRRSARIGFDSMPVEEVIDFRAHLEMAVHGRIHLSRKVLGAYRWHAAGISKNPVFRAYIENAYEKTFERARELGVAPEIVNAGMLRHRMSLAISRLVTGDYPEFRRLISIPSKWMLIAQPKHILLYFFHPLCRLGSVQDAIKRKVSV